MIEYLSEIFFQNSNMLLFFASFLAILLPSLHYLASLKLIHTTHLRKLFHMLAVLLFVPPMVTAAWEGAATTRFCVFSLNCASVALVGLEMVRAS